MAIIKSYTTIEQSKKLAEILPLESADMLYWMGEYITHSYMEGQHKDEQIPIWSLAALLNVLPKVINNETLFIETSPALWHIGYRNSYTARASNLVDACYELILELHKLNML